MPSLLYFVHITDTHIGPSRGYSLHGNLALPYAQRLVDSINALPTKPDFVIHTGDVVTDPHPESYRFAAETLEKLRVPIYYVAGNHDDAIDMRRELIAEPCEWLNDAPDVLSYAFERKGYRFVVLDACGPAEIDPQGLLSDQQLAVARREAQPDGPPLIIFMHYPTLPMDSPWMDGSMRVQNWRELHAALLPARERIRGVFYGHVHRSMQTLRDGILYVAAGSSLTQFTAWPSDQTTGYAAYAPPAFNFVHLLPEQTIIHQHTF